MQATTTLAPHTPAGAPSSSNVAYLATVSRTTIWAEGARVEVEQYRPHRADPSAPHVVFLHGWGMSHAGYRTGLSLMAYRGACVDAYALPGYSGSDPLPVRACGLAEHARRIAAALEESAYDRPLHLVGHSFGGGIALTLAASRPDLVAHVTAVCPVGGAAGGTAPWPSLVRSFLTDGGTAGLSTFLRSFGPALRRSPITMASSGFAARRADLTTELRQAKLNGVPVHLVLARNDAIVPPGPLAHPAFGARLSVVDGGHSWPHQNSREWADAVLTAPALAYA